jgi:hypothetical protein
MPVTVMIPRGLLKDDGPVSGRRLPVVAADIDNPTGRQISVNGRSDWMQAGLPSLLEVSVERIRHLKGHTELELRGTDVVVKLRFADSVVEPEATLGQLVAAGGRETEAAQRYRDEAHAALATLLPGDLRELEDSRKRSILAALQSAPGSPDVHVHEGQLYASYDLGVDGLVYNDRDFDRPTIVAYVLNETVLTRLRDISRSLPDVPELRGIRVVHRIPHKSAKNAPADEYRLEIVATTEQGVKFSEGAISDQALLDASVLLIDGSPLQIRLAASSD